MAKRTPLWMNSLIAVGAFGLVIGFGCWIFYYAHSARLYSEWKIKQELSGALERQRQPLEEELTLLEDQITTARSRFGTLQTTHSDEREAIANLLIQDDKHLQSITTNIAKIRGERRDLLAKIDEVRDEWSREQDTQLENASEHERALSDLRQKVKEISHEIEREQEAARVVELELERDIARLESRVQELLNQKQIETNELRPDGSIASARPDLGFAIIDLGWEDNLRPGTKFEIFANRGGRTTIKGSLVVTKVEERISHTRILEERDRNNPIIPGDLLHNPIYDPNETKIFVIEGHFQDYSTAELQRFIREAGGVVENELSTRTNYLVAGENSDVALEQATNFGVTILSEKKLIEFIRMPTGGPRSTLQVEADK